MSKDGEEEKKDAEEQPLNQNDESEDSKAKGNSAENDQEGTDGKEGNEGDEGDEGGLPNGVKPFFVTSATQELFECVVDEHVSVENPFKYIPLEKIKEDFIMRAAVSDFSAVKAELQAYDGEEVLLVFDDFEHGENFLICLTEAAKEAYLKSLQRTGGDGDGVGEEGGDIIAGEQTEEEEVLLLKKKRLPRDWVSLGSEKEIEESQFKPTRKKMCFLLSRKRRLFGAPVSFADDVVREEAEFPPAAEYKSQKPLEDAPPPIHKLLVDASVQAIKETSSSTSQTTWFPKKNMGAQWEPQYITKEQQTALDEEDLNECIVNAYEKIKRSLQTNSVIDVYSDDFLRLRGTKGISVSSKAESSLKDYQTFKYMAYGKHRGVSSIDFHPTISGVVVVAYEKNMSFERRVKEVDPREKSQALIWSLVDPVMPKITLLAPDDILSIAFCPTNPAYIAGGLRNGQVVFWDIDKAAQVLNPAFHESTKNEIEVDNLVPIVKSNIETGHRAGVTFLEWLPAPFDVDDSGRVREEVNIRNCNQFITCSADGLALVWDIRPPEDIATFKSLDLNWNPHMQVYLTSEGSGVVLAQGLCLYQSHSNMAAHRGGDDMNGKLIIITQSGQLIHISMERPKADGGKLAVQKPTAVVSAHGGEGVKVKRSPFMPELYLSIGGTTMTLWHEKCTKPLMSYTYSNASRPVALEWSLQRPCVWFVGRFDGFIDTWDLCDSSYRPILSNSVSAPTQLTCIHASEMPTPTDQGMLSLLSTGDNNGTVHMVELPSTLVNPSDNEDQLLKHFVEREIERVEKGTATTISSLKMKKHFLEGLEEVSSADIARITKDFEKMENDFLITMGLKEENADDIGF
eukprot:m.143021 g.143021  ORF g.143021 m.143021 type:complete len:854 (+) comp13199_c1_seq2:122-2683(+)